MLGQLTIVLVTFVSAEAGTYLAHRFVMHGFGMGWHRSHHSPPTGPFERNDRFPLLFASITIVVMAAARSRDLHSLLLVTIGVTAYGLSYLVVHDLYIHRRFGVFRGPVPALERLARAHELHHLFGGEPYGMLFPVVPRSLKARADGVAYDIAARRRSTRAMRMRL